MGIVKASNKDKFIDAFIEYCKEVGGEPVVKKRQIECDFEMFRLVIDKNLKWVKAYEATPSGSLRLTMWDEPKEIKLISDRLSQINPLTGRKESIDVKRLVLNAKDSFAIVEQRGALKTFDASRYIAPEFIEEYRRKREHFYRHLYENMLPKARAERLGKYKKWQL